MVGKYNRVKLFCILSLALIPVMTACGGAGNVKRGTGGPVSALAAQCQITQYILCGNCVNGWRSCKLHHQGSDCTVFRKDPWPSEKCSVPGKPPKKPGW